jgi:Mrp family chromosome partitioning ATPase/uncharacterized protein involved in exopolysaccharide biosynthesis
MSRDKVMTSEENFEFQDPSGSAPNPLEQLLKVHLLLKGRYGWAAGLSATFSIIGIVIAYFVAVPLYRSVGIIKILPVMPRVLEQTSLMPMFDAFLQSQISLISSRRVVDLAMTNPDWMALGKAPASFSKEERDDAIEAFTASLEVTLPPRSELILVAFNDPDPKVAMLSASAVIKAYEALFEEWDVSSSDEVLQTLESKRINLELDLKAIRKQKTDITTLYGTDSLSKTIQTRSDALAKMDQELRELELVVADMGQSLGLQDADAAAKLANGETAPAVAEGLTPEQLAVVDPDMKSYIKRKLEQEASASELEAKYGSGHPSVVIAKNTLASTERTIQNYLEASRIQYTDKHYEQSARKTVDRNEPAAGTGKPTKVEYDKQVQRLVDKKKNYEESKASIVEMGLKQQQIEQLDEQEKDKSRKLGDVNGRLDQIKDEAVVGGRMQVVSSGDDPISPYKDRRAMFMSAGAVGGVCMGFGVMLFVGLLDRRLRHLDDTRIGFGSAPFLGSLPNLPAEITDTEQASDAAHCVHHVRNLLQISAHTMGQQVFAITSPAAGSGKTSLTLSLGLSFAAAECKTLIIDCDLIGAGLTSRVNTIIRRKVGQIMLREGLINEQQLEQALAVAKESSKRLGEILIDLGCLDADKVSHALEIQGEAPIGLLDALAGETLEGCVTTFGIDRLFILPIGAAQAHDAVKLSRRALRRLLDEARKKFDIILLDTGPILGSLEASIATTESDSVVMVAARGEDRALADKAFAQLAVVGARVAGIVFNRAEFEDFNRSIYSKSYSRSTGLSSTDRRTSVSVDATDTLRSYVIDPVAHAVASSTGLHSRLGNSPHPWSGPRPLQPLIPQRPRRFGVFTPRSFTIDFGPLTACRSRVRAKPLRSWNTPTCSS